MKQHLQGHVERLPTPPPHLSRSPKLRLVIMSSVQAMDFHRFLELPFEIRWTIYEFCLPTRVIDSEIGKLDPVRNDCIIKEEQLALRHIVAKFSRTPVIARASPEVYREIRRHMASPPHGEWVWNWWRWDAKGFTDPRPVYFDPRSDLLCISPEKWFLCKENEEYLERGPCCLADGRDVTVALDERAIDCLFTWDKLTDYCLRGRKNCIIILEETIVIEPVERIVSCGLFGHFGEERTVLVDVDDLERIDYFDRKLNGWHVVPRQRSVFRGLELPRGLRRYSSHGTAAEFETAWCEDSPVVSNEERAQVIAEDKEKMLHEIKELWLEFNHCFDGTETDNPSFVPSEGERGDRVFDEEHPNAEPWYEKLPTFSFAVRVHAQDSQEQAQLSKARKARYTVEAERRRRNRHGL